MLPPFLRRFVRDASRPASEVLLSCGRKNAKTTAVSVLLLAGLAGPLSKPGWRAVVSSVNAAKAIEVRAKVSAIAKASGIKLVERRCPEPGSLALDNRVIDFAAGTSAAGHAVDADVAVVDEAGLLTDRDRGLFAGIRSALGARDGTIIVTGTRLGGWAVQDVERRAADPGVYVHSYSASPDAETGDRRQWARANPGLRSGIKSRDYLVREWRRAEGDEAAARAFRSHELNLAEHPERELLLSADQWRKCIDVELPERRGRVAIGIDVGGGTSLSAVCAFWPASGRTGGLRGRGRLAGGP